MTDKAKMIIEALGHAAPKIDLLPNNPKEGKVAELMQQVLKGEPLLDIKLGDFLELTLGDILQVVKIIEQLAAA